MSDGITEEFAASLANDAATPLPGAADLREPASNAEIDYSPPALRS